MSGLKKTYDVLLKNLKILDGTDAPAFYGDIGIKGDVIVLVGKAEGNGEKELDCTGLIAAPGFIDIHNHSDFSVIFLPDAPNYLSQGVTTLVVGNCGYSGAPLTPKNRRMFEKVFGKNLPLEMESENMPFGAYLKILDKYPKAVNIANLVGHGNIRGAVLGLEDVKPSKEEMDEMKRVLSEAMESGAFGISTGLIYDPGIFADTNEIAELCSVVKEYRGIYATHIRNESDLLVDAVMEAIEVGKKTGVRVQISHHKASGKRNWGLIKTTLDLMQYYRRRGVEVTCDVYPCTFANTGLYDCLPSWIRGQAFEEQIAKKDVRERFRSELSRPSYDFENIILDAGFDGLIISSSEKFKEFEGKSIAEISKILEMDPYDTIFHLLEKDRDIYVLAGGMSEDDVRYIIKHDLSMVCSDSEILEFGEGKPHPRGYMTFRKVISSYVREENLLSLEEAVKKMTYLPAWKLGLHDRGGAQARI
ncbi:MAG: N-acyl-D-amino-acid deacylase [Tepidanaerobacteraceae bacterium]|nr:N-acyl-D-amino-acid deacylase [Tepidanaerobacteraceae bacterium]